MRPLFRDFNKGNLVTNAVGSIVGEVIEVLDNTLIIETGHNIVIRHKIDMYNFHSSVGDTVYVKGTNKSFIIDSFYFSDKSLDWKAEHRGETQVTAVSVLEPHGVTNLNELQSRNPERFHIEGICT